MFNACVPSFPALPLEEILISRDIPKQVARTRRKSKQTKRG